MRRPRPLLLALLISSLAAPAGACLWDYDTLQMERERFPGALELIVGKFLRHTDEFYEWRVKDRRAKIAAHDAGEKKLTDEALARAYDDLAAALDKLKRHDEAIATIREKADRLPNVGRYETHANLGTFLAHSGKLDEGIAELKKAIEINPEAHFGREKYQVLVIEYVTEKRGEGGPAHLPLDDSQRGAMLPNPFPVWMLHQLRLADEHGKITNDRGAEREIDGAIDGVLGMMRFGDYRSPVLLEILGDLLLTGAQYREANFGERLAARAYLQASEAAESQDARDAYREMAKYALTSQAPDAKSGEADFRPGDELYGLSFVQLQDQLRREVQEADAWFAKTIAHDEDLWITKSPDPDRRFWEKYGGQNIRVGHDRLPPAQYASKGLTWPYRAALGGGLLVTLALLAAAMSWRRRHPTGYTPHEPQPRTD